MLKVRETVQFTAELFGLSGSVTWSISDSGGGKITADGSYLAPDAPGVYEVTAVSTAKPNVSSSAFVVVTAYEVNDHE
jgi:hypothetical protein